MFSTPNPAYAALWRHDPYMAANLISAIFSPTNPAFAALAREGSSSDPLVIAALWPNDPYLAGYLTSQLRHR